MTRRLIVVGATAAALVLPVATANAAPAERSCRGTIANTVISSTVRVPAGATCTLKSVTIKGALIVEARASQTANSITVARSITSNGHTKVAVASSKISGAVSLSRGGAISLISLNVTGDVTLTGNPRGTKVLKSNFIRGKLSCTTNTPAPTGSANVAIGGKFGQCARL